MFQSLQKIAIIHGYFDKRFFSFVFAFLLLTFYVRGQTTVTINSTGISNSYNTGSVSAAGIKNDGGIIDITSNINRGWARFDLSTIPSGAIVSSVNCKFTTYSSLSSLVLNDLFGFSGDPSAITGTNLYNACGSGVSFNNSAWVENGLNVAALNAAGISFIQNQIPSGNACIGFVRGSTNVYNIYGYASAERPQLEVTYTVPPLCSGTPLAGITTGPANACPGNNFLLTVKDASTNASALTYQWQVSIDGVSYSNIVGSFASSLSVSQTSAKYYRCLVTCSTSGLTATSTPRFVGIICYCESSALTTDDEEILSVSLGTLNNSSTCETTGIGSSIEKRYSDFTNVEPPTLLKTNVYQLSIGVGTCNGEYYNYTNAYIDFNQNGSFDDAGEKVYESALINGPHAVSVEILIPASASIGKTGMRIITSEDIISSCGSYYWGETEDYLVNIATPSPCAGLPTAGEAVFVNSNSCPGVNSLLSLTGSSIATGLTYQWQSATDGIIFTNIEGATAFTASVFQTQSTDYRCIVTCTASGLSSVSVSTNLTIGNSLATCACTSGASNDGDTEILSVSLGSLINGSTCATIGAIGSILNQYSNFTLKPSPDLFQNSSYPLSIQIGTCAGSYSNATKVFIDYNQNGSFADAGENVYTSGGAVAGGHVEASTVLIPSAALLGHTLMRVVTVETSTPGSITSCGSYSYGETEDYVVNILPSACAGTPSAGTTIGPLSSCSGINFLLSLTGASANGGLNYQWQSSIDGTTYSDIPGETKSTAYLSQTVGLYYRCKITCSLSALASTSVPLKVKQCQSISLSTINNKVYGDPGFTLTASSSSALALNFASSNPNVATVDGSGLVAIVGVGTTDITASQSGDGNFAAAADVTQTFTVARAVPTLTINSLNSVNFANNLALTATSNSNGLITFSVAGGTGKGNINGTTLTPTSAGTVIVTASIAQTANFTAGTTTQTITIIGSTPTLAIASSDHATFGNALSLSVNTNSLGVVTYSVVNGSGSASLNGSTLSPLSPGTITVTANLASSGQYNQASISMLVTIDKANQTITFPSLVEKKINDAPFTLAATSTSGLTVSYTSSNPTVASITGNIVTIIGAGTTNISAIQSGNNNYNSATLTQLLTIMKLSQTIGFNALPTRILGDGPFTPSATASSGLAVTFSTSSDKVSINGNIVTLLKAGSVTIQAAQVGNASFASAPNVEKTFCINPSKPLITISQASSDSPVLNSNSLTGNQWFKDGDAIAGGISPTFSPEQAGVYTVVVSVDNCMSAPSDTMPIVVTEIEDVNALIQIYPSPVDNELVIDGSQFNCDTPINVLIYDVLGRRIDSFSSKDIIKINTSFYPAGNYLIYVNTGDKIFSKQIVKK
jgi:hypothetical protein